MAEIVSLRLARKRKRREQAALAAAANRGEHGTSRADASAQEARRRVEEVRFQAHRREPAPVAAAPDDPDER